MPKKFLRRWLPSSKTFSSNRSLRLLQPLLKEPNLFHLNRHSVSMATFVGVFTAFLPLPGQTLIAAMLALLVRSNLPIAIALIWITNPFTIGPIFYLTFELGRWMLDSPPMSFHFVPTWEWFQVQGEHLLAPLFLGSLITGLSLGLLGYLFIHQFWRWQVVRSWEARKANRNLKIKSVIRSAAHRQDGCEQLSTQDTESPENSEPEQHR
jgi:uncharacterized protein